ncbi:MAG: hypothetical protein N2255_09515, partial [Kiritimatiellae bacterium]|nr:hypothetical protein [Kiritimatiellia bacterium]
MPKVLMACSLHWTSPLRVGSHHLANAFARRDWEVGFVSYPICPLHGLYPRTTDFRRRLAMYR